MYQEHLKTTQFFNSVTNNNERVPFTVMLHNFLINCVTHIFISLSFPTFPLHNCCRPSWPTTPFYTHFTSVPDLIISLQMKITCVPPGISIKLSYICSCSYHDCISYDCCAAVGLCLVITTIVYNRLCVCVCV